MLTKVVIHRFRTCRDVTLSNLGPTVALVGPNGAGKTNILKAIWWAARLATRDAQLKLLTVERGATLEFEARRVRYRYEINPPGSEGGDGPSNGRPAPVEALHVRDGGAWRMLGASRGGEFHVEGREERLLPGLPILAVLEDRLQGRPDAGHVANVRGFLGGVRYYPLDEPDQSPERASLIDERSVGEWADHFADASAREDAVIPRLLHMALRRPDDFQEVRAILCREGLGLLDDIVIEPFESKPAGEGRPSTVFHKIGFRPRVAARPAMAESAEGPLLRFAQLSLGTRRIVRIAASLIHDRSSVLLVEHPEDGIHRGLLYKVFSLLRTYTEPAQLLLTTHSEYLLDELRDDPAAVRLVTMEDGRTRARALTRKQVALAKRYINEAGPFSGFLQMQEDL